MDVNKNNKMSKSGCVFESCTSVLPCHPAGFWGLCQSFSAVQSRKDACLTYWMNWTRITKCPKFLFVTFFCIKTQWYTSPNHMKYTRFWLKKEGQNFFQSGQSNSAPKLKSANVANVFGALCGCDIDVISKRVPFSGMLISDKHF